MSSTSTVPSETSGRPVRWLVLAAVLSILVVALSVVVVLLLVRDAQPATLHAWADVGQAFGAVSATVSAAALIALIFTFAAQQHELKGQRKELQLQAESLAQSRQELRCTAETNLAMYHLKLLEMSFTHPQLGSVWPSWSSDLPPDVNLRRLYCNMILDGVWLNKRTGRFGDGDVRALVSYLFTSPEIREYWASTRQSRQMAVEDEGPEAPYFRVIDEVFAQYDAA